MVPRIFFTRPSKNIYPQVGFPINSNISLLFIPLRIGKKNYREGGGAYVKCRYSSLRNGVGGHRNELGIFCSIFKMLFVSNTLVQKATWKGLKGDEKNHPAKFHEVYRRTRFNGVNQKKNFGTVLVSWWRGKRHHEVGFVLRDWT